MSVIAQYICFYRIRLPLEHGMITQLTEINGYQVRYVFLTHLAVAWYGTRVYELITAPGRVTAE